MEERVQNFFDWLVSRLFEGELDWLDDVYVYPIAMFIGGEIRIEHGPKDSINYLTLRRRHAVKQGVYAMSANVIQVSRNPQSDHFSARVEFMFHGADGGVLGVNKSHYRCHLTSDDRIMVESLEIFEIGLPFLSSLPKANRH